MSNNQLVPALLLFSLFATSSAYLYGAGVESCYNHSVVHTVVLPTETVITPSSTCNDPCGYQLYLIGEIGKNSTLVMNASDSQDFVYKLDTTYLFSLTLRTGVEIGEPRNGFAGFLVQAREDTDTFDTGSSIHGTWEGNRTLYRPLNCGKSKANTSILYPNSATQTNSRNLTALGPSVDVLLYWVSPDNELDAPTVAFWYTIVQQHRAHFFPVKGPIGTPIPPTTDPPATDPPTTDPPTTDPPATDPPTTDPPTTDPPTTDPPTTHPPTTHPPTTHPPTTDPPTTDPSTTEAPLGNTSSQAGGDDSSLFVILGAVVGVLLFMLLLMVGVVVCILTWRRFTDKGKPEVVSERQLVEGRQRGGISNGIHSTETIYAEVIELVSQKQTTEKMSSNPSYMPNTDASINYEDDMYSYIDPEDVRILARNPIVSEDDIQLPTADNVAYGSAIPQDHSDQVPTADNVAYGSTVQ